MPTPTSCQQFNGKRKMLPKYWARAVCGSLDQISLLCHFLSARTTVLQMPRGSNIKSFLHLLCYLCSAVYRAQRRPKKGNNLLTLKHRSLLVLVTEHHENLSFSSTLKIHVTYTFSFCLCFNISNDGRLHRFWQLFLKQIQLKWGAASWATQL